MFLYTNIYIYLEMSIHVSTPIYIYVRVYTCIQTHLYTPKYLCMQLCFLYAHIRVSTHTHTRTRKHTCAHTRTCTCARTRTHTRTRTRIFTHIHTEHSKTRIFPTLEINPPLESHHATQQFPCCVLDSSKVISRLDRHA